MPFPAKTFRPFRKELRLQHSPVVVVARSSSYASSGAHQVLLEAIAGGMAFTQFMSAAEAREVGQALLDAAAHYESHAVGPENRVEAPCAHGLDVLELGNAGIDGGDWTATPATADGHAAPLPTYPTGTRPTCQAAGVDSLGHGFDRRAQPDLGQAA